MISKKKINRYMYSSVSRCYFVINNHKDTKDAFHEMEERIMYLYTETDNPENDMFSINFISCELEIMVLRFFIRYYTRYKFFPSSFPSMEHTGKEMLELGLGMLERLQKAVINKKDDV